MRRPRWARGGRIATIAASLSLLLTGCSAHDIEKKLRFGWLTGITRQSQQMRTLWTWACVAALVLGIIVWGLIFWSCIRYRRRRRVPHDEIPRQTKYNLLIEGIGVTVPILIIGVLFWRTAVVEDNVNKLSKHPDVLVQVDAFKWNWQFEYLDDHGKKLAYGQGDPRAGSPLSTVGSDLEIPVLVIPVNQKVRFIEHSFDVVHSFWVPEFLFKRDVIPFYENNTKEDNQFEITPITTGQYVGRCAELCGTYHSQMNFEVRVVTEAQFRAYLAQLQQIGSANPQRQALALTRAHIPGGPVATTTHPFVTDRHIVGSAAGKGQ